MPSQAFFDLIEKNKQDKVNNPGPPDFNDGPYYLEKFLPSSPDSEKAILGGIILDNSLIEQALQYISFKDFYHPIYKKVFKAMTFLNDNNQKIDPILIGEEIRKEISLETLGGLKTILDLTYGLPHFSSIESYALIVRNKSKARQLIEKCRLITTRALEESEEIDETLAFAEDELYELSDTGVSSSFADSKQLVEASIAKSILIEERGNPITGLSTGLHEVDQLLLGLQDNDLIIVAARPGMGKTAFGIGVASNAAYYLDKNVAFFSLEMAGDQLAHRIICGEAKVDSKLYNSGQMSFAEREKINQANRVIISNKLYIDEQQAISPANIKQKLRRLIKELKANPANADRPDGKVLDLLVVDYIGLMSPNYSKNQRNRQEEVASISKEMKQIAKLFKIPLILFCQLNRGPEARINHRPNLGDLRESGSIEQDADVVAFIYRESMYPKADGMVLGEGEAEIIIAKNRNGPTGTIRVAYIKEATKFDNLITNY